MPSKSHINAFTKKYANRKAKVEALKDAGRDATLRNNRIIIAKKKKNI